jgi:hypothetical protein
MSHFAEIGADNKVIRVIVAEQDFIDSGAVGDPKNWIQTSYNTYKGSHRLGGTPLRKNFAGVGYKYDKERDAFIPPKPHDSWVLNEETCDYEPPVPLPQDADMKNYGWSEKDRAFVEVPLEESLLSKLQEI